MAPRMGTPCHTSRRSEQQEQQEQQDERARKEERRASVTHQPVSQPGSQVVRLRCCELLVQSTVPLVHDTVAGGSVRDDQSGDQTLVTGAQHRGVASVACRSLDLGAAGQRAVQPKRQRLCCQSDWAREIHCASCYMYVYVHHVAAVASVAYTQRNATAAVNQMDRVEAILFLSRVLRCNQLIACATTVVGESIAPAA